MEDNKKIQSENNKKIDEEKNLIELEINKTQQEMAAALNQFEIVIEPELIDYYTYIYKASSAKYSYLMKKLKKIYNI